MSPSTLMLLQLIIPSALTVIGWFIAAWWAIAQVNKSNKNNIALQKIVLQENHKQYIVKELNDIYKITMTNIDEFSQSLINSVISYGVSFQKDKLAHYEKPSYYIEGVYITQSSMSAEIHKLEMWIETVGTTLVHTDSFKEALDKYKALFVLGVHQEDFSAIPWVKLHGMLKKIENNNPVDFDELKHEYAKLIGEVVEISNLLKASIKMINNDLGGSKSDIY